MKVAYKRKIPEKLGGDITVISKVRKDSCFTLTIDNIKIS